MSTPKLYIYHEPTHQEFLSTIDTMVNGRSLQQNYDGPIVEFIHDRVRKLSDDRIIFIVLSDGVPAGHNYGTKGDRENFKQILEKCKRDEFVVGGVMIQTDLGSDLYSYSTMIRSLDDMPRKVSNLVNHIVKTEFQ
jgi:hypothetical protein